MKRTFALTTFLTTGLLAVGCDGCRSQQMPKNPPQTVHTSPQKTSLPTTSTSFSLPTIPSTQPSPQSSLPPLLQNIPPAPISETFSPPAVNSRFEIPLSPAPEIAYTDSCSGRDLKPVTFPPSKPGSLPKILRIKKTTYPPSTLTEDIFTKINGDLVIARANVHSLEDELNFFIYPYYQLSQIIDVDSGHIIDFPSVVYIPTLTSIEKLILPASSPHFEVLTVADNSYLSVPTSKLSHPFQTYLVPISERYGDFIKTDGEIIIPGPVYAPQPYPLEDYLNRTTD